MSRLTEPPSLLAVFNWIGILSHGGYLAVAPFVGRPPLALMMGLALLLFLGHLYLWDLRRRRRQRRGAGD